MWEAVYKVNVLNSGNAISREQRKYTERDLPEQEGFAIWYVNHPPKMKGIKEVFLGYKPDFNGLGIIVFKHENVWRLQTIANEGLEGLNLESAATTLQKDNNHCKMYDFNGGRIDIKVELRKSSLFVSYALGDESNFRSCISGRNYPNVHK